MYSSRHWRRQGLDFWDISGAELVELDDCGNSREQNSRNISVFTNLGDWVDGDCLLQNTITILESLFVPGAGLSDLNILFLIYSSQPVG